MPRFLTTKQVGDLIGRPEWEIRRIVDSLGTVERFGHKRMIPAELVETIRDAAEERKHRREECPS